jgi:acyl phosphate:glycerol-3-phosphate acyltransferase
MLIIAFLLFLLSYWYGCFSTARLLAKSFRSLNIYKVGSGLSDTENIYSNVSKPLGVLAGGLDILKSYAWLYFLRLALVAMDKMSVPPDLSSLYTDNLMLLYGLGLLIGHCLPLTHRLRGGRGIFTYFGIVLFFSFYPSLITGLLAMALVYGFKQMRFAQYTIVILPVLLNLVLAALPFTSALILPQHSGGLFTTKLLGMALAMGVLNFIVSKRLGEF